ncbi:hypothetical protein PVW48_06025 [Dinoroseobacter sp. PD6]|uniref:hypothetical protein n=1 Tax=Dinoroseobacter sp. PD6 TaxID=3028384 RepID=UPI00237A9174|nr:hypothetical protein [Dinoroseobacter sp. PD6]MDD9716292.1 hypothetical protein [Dinoroseobacter sp. PD6]
MTIKVDDLIKNFSDGKLPTGENFADLINSMVHKDDFTKAQQAFEDFKARGEITLGPSPGQWQLGVNEDAQLRVLELDAEGKPPASAEAGDILLGGWVNAAGRLGPKLDAYAFEEGQTELPVAHMSSVASDGGWHDILAMPGRPCAFEITAATARTVYPATTGFGTAFKSLLGITTEPNGIAHGTCTAVGGHRKPALSLTSQPSAEGVGTSLALFLGIILGLFLLGLLLIGTQAEGAAQDALIRAAAQLEQGVGSLMTSLRITGVEASEVVTVYLPLAVLGLAGLYLLRQLNRLRHLKSRAVSLRWKKAGGSALMDDRTWTLQLRGPPLPPGPEEAKVYYTITKLWA